MQFYNFLKTRITSLPYLEQKDTLNFCERLITYSHVPSNYKEICRMKQFALNENLVKIILDNLSIYDFDKNHGITDISFWYSVSLLLLTTSDKNRIYIETLAQKMIKEDHEDLWIFQRIMNSNEFSYYSNIKTQITIFISKKINYLEPYLWAEEVGLSLPYDSDWEITFFLESDNEFSVIRNGSKENDFRFDMRLTLFPLQGNDIWFINFSKLFWSKDINNNLAINSSTIINGYLPSEESKIKNKINLKTPLSLMNLKEFIKELEDFYKIRFDQNNYRIRTSGKVKNKNAIKKWLFKIERGESPYDKNI